MMGGWSLRLRWRRRGAEALRGGGYPPCVPASLAQLILPDGEVAPVCPGAPRRADQSFAALPPICEWVGGYTLLFSNTAIES